jgi:hypothetical protein
MFEGKIKKIYNNFFLVFLTKAQETRKENRKENLFQSLE